LALVLGAWKIAPELSSVNRAIRDPELETVTFSRVSPISPHGISGDSAFDEAEERLIFYPTTIIIDQRREKPYSARRLFRDRRLNRN
jgi:hypothetical protein